MAEEIVRDKFKKIYAVYVIQKKEKNPHSSKKVNFEFIYSLTLLITVLECQ